jgi:hypothetical protein
VSFHAVNSPADGAFSAFVRVPEVSDKPAFRALAPAQKAVVTFLPDIPRLSAFLAPAAVPLVNKATHANPSCRLSFYFLSSSYVSISFDYQ